MAETAIAEESLNLRSEARDILVSPTHEGIAIVVEQLCRCQESNEYQRAHALYNFCVSNFPGCLTLQILMLYRSSASGVLRSQSIHLLSETLADFKNPSFNLSLGALYEIKPLLISCLRIQETKESDFKILRRIVYFVAYTVVILYNGKWNELSDCIFSLADNEPSKAFHVFIDLPPVDEEFLCRLLYIIMRKADNVFLSPEQSGVEDWTLALKAVVKMGIQLLNTKMSLQLQKNLMERQVSFVVNSATELVKKGMEQFLVRGLEDFERFLSRDVSLFNYTKEQCHLVSAFMERIEGVGRTQTKEILRKIKMLITEPDNAAIKPHGDLENHRAEFDRDWYDHLKNLSLREVVRIYASTDLQDRFREIAIRQLNVLLSDHTSGKKAKIDISVMIELQPLLICFLKEEGVSDSIFKVLGEVVNHVAYEIFDQDKTWNDLRCYIESKSKTEFQRAVYIFQCLTMPLVDFDFLDPVIESLLPGIRTRLNPPTELLVDNICWVLAFTGAFCVTIYMLDNPSRVNEIAHKMVDSVRALVERGMEVGLVRRAFRDLESIVKKQLDWYVDYEYEFVKGLLWRLYAIKGMKWESKIVLWRINVIVERQVMEEFKQLPENEFDWLQDDDFVL